MKILLVEDDALLSCAITRALKAEYHISHAPTLREASLHLSLSHFDLILLDIQLPDGNGQDLCRKLRSSRDATPVVVVTGEPTLTHKLLLFDAGVDDYVQKPFALEELRARVRAILRRSDSLTENTTIAVGPVTLYTQSAIVNIDGRHVQLRPKESLILEYLMRHPQIAVPREQLFAYAWPYHSISQVSSVTVHIKHLRSRIESASLPPMIHTVQRRGYMFRASAQYRQPHPSNGISTHTLTSS